MQFLYGQKKQGLIYNSQLQLPYTTVNIVCIFTGCLNQVFYVEITLLPIIIILVQIRIIHIHICALYVVCFKSFTFTAPQQGSLLNACLKKLPMYKINFLPTVGDSLYKIQYAGYIKLYSCINNRCKTMCVRTYVRACVCVLKCKLQKKFSSAKKSS